MRIASNSSQPYKPLYHPTIKAYSWRTLPSEWSNPAAPLTKAPATTPPILPLIKEAAASAPAALSAPAIQVKLPALAAFQQTSMKGDMNGDGSVNQKDVDPFVLALTNPREFAAQFPNVNIMNADINGDSKIDFADIDPFAALLPRKGDMNGDGKLNKQDIDPFVLALIDPEKFKATYPTADIMNADINEDGVVNALDIDPFVKLLEQNRRPPPAEDAIVAYQPLSIADSTITLV